MPKILIKTLGEWQEWDVEQIVILEGSVTYPKVDKALLHTSQQAILELSKTNDLTKMTLREIGEWTGINHPQKVDHHIKQLKKRGLL